MYLRAVTLFALAAVGLHPAESADRAGIAFFEEKIRPLLVARCVKCHGPTVQKAGLRLDRTPYIRTGSDSGPVISPGTPDRSKLIRAVRYQDPDLQMPPTGKLSKAEIALLEQWVRMGAPMPDEPSEPAASQTDQNSVFRQRARHWSYSPLRRVYPPVLDASDWATSPVDLFVLRRHRAAGVTAAPPADRATLIRRATYDLLGLPPSLDQLQTFLNDPRPDAFDRLLDRLLASPHYGERWGRHWLDLVRYAETRGHEFDFDIFNAWRYRDYVIRAFNADIPYDRFVLEHIAGDLLDPPRRDPGTGLNESIVATAFWWLGEGKHSPVAVKREEADRIANQLNVFGKAFLGQTLVCARCHDHKFDPIRQEDYYAMAGFLTSSRYQQAFLDPPEKFAAPCSHMGTLRDRALRNWLRHFDPQRTTLRLKSALLAACDVLQGKPVDVAAAQHAVPTTEVKSAVELLRSRAKVSIADPLAVAFRLATAQTGIDSVLGDLQREWQTLAAEAAESYRPVTVFEGFWSRSSFARNWFATGYAFGDRPVHGAELGPLSGEPLRLLEPGTVDSARLSKRLEGVLRSRTFPIERPYIHVLAAGQGGRIHVVIDNFVLIRNPIYGDLRQVVDAPELRWYTIDVSMWRGERAYIEIVDSSMPTPSHNLSREAKEERPRDDWIRVDEIVFSDDERPPTHSAPLTGRLLAALRDSPRLETLCTWYANVVVQTLLRARSEQPLADQEQEAKDRVALVNAFLHAGLLGGVLAEEAEPLTHEYTAVEQTLGAPARAPAMSDGSAWNEYVHIRGIPENKGPVVPRRFLAIFAGTTPIESSGSGRLQLARQVIDPAVTPVLPRVMVNRVWQHHFGRGIVPTPDDFGHMGQPPTHPDLLEWLAQYFIEHDWSVKRLHRLIMLSSTYRMSGRADPGAVARDPNNRLYHHMPLRRLEAEAIRDAILAVSGRLNRTMFGPGVLPYLTPFMEGRGRPSTSGPLDGDGRRSIYINVRRNFLTPMLLVFDYPVPFTTIGQRSVSNVPAQALTLMNSPFVVQQARRWAEKLLHELPDSDNEVRVRRLYLEAFSREPTATELHAAMEFLAAQAKEYGTDANDIRVWADLCHVLFNVKEFIFIP